MQRFRTIERSMRYVCIARDNKIKATKINFANLCVMLSRRSLGRTSPDLLSEPPQAVLNSGAIKIRSPYGKQINERKL